MILFGRPLLPMLLTMLLVALPLTAQNGHTVPLPEVSGVRIPLEVFHNVLTRGLDTLVPPPLRGPVRVIRDGLARHLEVEALSSATAERLLPRLDDATISTLASWSQSPTGLKLARAVRSLSMQEGQASFRRYEEWVRHIRPSHRRQLLLERLDQNLGATTLSRRVLLPFVDTLLAAANLRLPAAERLSMAEVQRIVRTVHPRVSKAIDQSYRAHWLYIFQSLTNDELQSYNELIESTAGSRFTGALRQVLCDFLEVTLRQTLDR